MAGNAKEFYERIGRDMEKMKQAAPDTVRAFGTLFQNVMKDGALKTKEKELIALGIGLAHRCAPCINMHVKKALEAGNTREELLEAAGVAVLMQGGPAYMHIPEVLEALEALGK